MKFDKRRCLANIYAIAKQLDLKIGELESKANMSAGYLSRLNKEENTTNPDIAALTIIAEELNVSLDFLISTDVTKLDATEEYIVKFIDKLCRDTDAGNITWIRESQLDLKETKAYNCGELEHPLFCDIDECEESNTVQSLLYTAVAPNGGSCSLEGDVFHVLLPNGACVYVTKVSYDKHEHEDCELFVGNGATDASGICSTYNAKLDVANAVFRLYDCAEKSMSKLRIHGYIKDFIDSYMKS